MTEGRHLSGSTLLFVTFTVAFCSIFYELLLAQSLSAIMGDTLLRYNTTIGTYIAAMGIGALLYGRLTIMDKARFLILIELMLAIVGATAPIAVVGIDYVLRHLELGDSIEARALYLQTGRYVFNYALVVAIGLISGIELPLLMAMGDEVSPGFGNIILASDYVGTLAGAVVFPMVLLPDFGLFQSAAVVGLANVLVAVFLVATGWRQRHTLTTVVCSAALVAIIAFVVRHQAVEQYVVAQVYMRD